MGQSSRDYFRERGRNRCQSHFFPIFDIWSHSRDIRDQRQILGGRPSKSYTNVMTPASRHVVSKMFCGDTPTSPEVIVAEF